MVEIYHISVIQCIMCIIYKTTAYILMCGKKAFPYLSPFRPLEAIYKNVLTVSYGTLREKLNLRHVFIQPTMIAVKLTTQCCSANIMTIAYDDRAHVSPLCCCRTKHK